MTSKEYVEFSLKLQVMGRDIESFMRQHDEVMMNANVAETMRDSLRIAWRALNRAECNVRSRAIHALNMESRQEPLF